MVYRSIMILSIYCVSMMSASEEKKYLLHDDTHKEKSKKMILDTYKKPLLRHGIRSFLSYFQSTIHNIGNWTHQTHEDQITITMMEQEYRQIKDDIDTNYKEFIIYPTKFDIYQMRMGGSGNVDVQHTVRRKNSREYVEALHRNSRNSPEPEKKELTTIVQTIYKRSFQKMNRFSGNFIKKKELFLEEYVLAEQAFGEKDFIGAYEAISLARDAAKSALWYLTHQKEEQRTINAMSECTSSSEDTKKESYDKGIIEIENKTDALG